MSRSRMMTLALFGVFAVAMMLALLFGAQVYRTLAEQRAQVEASRIAWGTLVNAVRGNDAFDAVAIGEHEGNALLDLAQHGEDGDYLVRLYVHDGQMMQQYAAADAPLNPEEAHPLFPTSSFSVVCEPGRLLVLRTDAGEAAVALRCAQPQIETAEHSFSAEGEGEAR